MKSRGAKILMVIGVAAAVVAAVSMSGLLPSRWNAIARIAGAVAGDVSRLQDIDGRGDAGARR